MILLKKGGLVARYAETDKDLLAAQQLRHFAFHGTPGRDADAFDGRCRHVLLEDSTEDRLVGCFRVNPVTSTPQMADSYAANSYDLTPMTGFAKNALEISRFCVHPDSDEADVLRLAFGVIAKIVDAQAVELLFGCSSFVGVDPKHHSDSFAYLGCDHVGPSALRPKQLDERALRLNDYNAEGADLRQGLKNLPPLLRSYLAMGAWVSDHAVVDTEMQTIHVFTGLEVAKIPTAKARALRALAA